MTRSVCSSPFWLLAWLIVAFSSVPARGQSVAVPSVPEPTHLQSIASAPGSKLAWAEVVGEIESSDAHAIVSAIEMEDAQGERVWGIKIMLEDSRSTDQLYLEQSLIAILQDELEFLEFTRQFDEECQAQRLCMHGIARCRPSQSVLQAYCPGRYATPDAEQGLSLYTPRRSFRFPSIATRQFGNLVREATRVLE